MEHAEVSADVGRKVKSHYIKLELFRVDKTAEPLLYMVYRTRNRKQRVVNSWNSLPAEVVNT